MQYFSDLWPLALEGKRNCIVDKSLKIIKLIRSAVRLILDNFRIVDFLSTAYHFSLHFDSILS